MQPLLEQRAVPPLAIPPDDHRDPCQPEQAELRTTPVRLAQLARQADIVFVGRD